MPFIAAERLGPAEPPPLPEDWRVRRAARRGARACERGCGRLKSFTRAYAPRRIARAQTRPLCAARPPRRRASRSRAPRAPRAARRAAAGGARARAATGPRGSRKVDQTSRPPGASAAGSSSSSSGRWRKRQPWTRRAVAAPRARRGSAPCGRRGPRSRRSARRPPRARARPSAPTWLSTPCTLQPAGSRCARSAASGQRAAAADVDGRARRRQRHLAQHGVEERVQAVAQDGSGGVAACRRPRPLDAASAASSSAQVQPRAT